MTSYVVLTIIGDDKPGLVEALAKVVNENGGNWLESSMSQLAGKFAGILKISVAESCAEGLVSALEGLDSSLKLAVEFAQTPSVQGSPVSLQLSLVGNDRPGIIKEISHALAGMSVNVEKLTTSCAPAPMAGSELFSAQAVLKVPPELEVKVLQLELERLADDLIVDIELN